MDGEIEDRLILCIARQSERQRHISHRFRKLLNTAQKLRYLLLGCDLRELRIH